MLIDTAGQVLLWVALALVVYTYGLYPILVILLALLRPRPVSYQDWEPRISFIITAHNEEQDIRAKLDNTLSLDYPRERLEVLVASDASTDGTHAIVEAFRARGVRLLASTSRIGKTLATQNAAREATGELLVFSDATGVYNREALRCLARAAADPGVGCVCGKVEYTGGETSISRGHQLYWWTEKLLRRAESAAGTTTVVSGSIHAVRRDLFPSSEGHQNYDLLLPLAMAEKGLRTVFEESAVSFEKPSIRARDEFRARVRAGIRAFSYLYELRRRRWVLNYPLFTWTVVSHKLLRWISPLWLMLLLSAHTMLAFRGGWWLWTLIIHCGVYVAAATAAAFPHGRGARWLAVPAFLATACAGFLVGLVSFLRGQRASTWNTIR